MTLYKITFGEDAEGVAVCLANDEQEAVRLLERRVMEDAGSGDPALLLGPIQRVEKVCSDDAPVCVYYGVMPL